MINRIRDLLADYPFVFATVFISVSFVAGTSFGVGQCL